MIRVVFILGYLIHKCLWHFNQWPCAIQTRFLVEIQRVECSNGRLSGRLGRGVFGLTGQGIGTCTLVMMSLVANLGALLSNVHVL